MTTLFSQSLELPCGAVLPNRLSKAAMTEGLATADGLPTAELARLYGLWSIQPSGYTPKFVSSHSRINFRKVGEWYKRKVWDTEAIWHSDRFVFLSRN